MYKTRRIICVCLISIFCLSLNGCWDSKDVENLAFPIAAAYDVNIESSEHMSEINMGPLDYPAVDITVIYPNLASGADARITVETDPAPTVAFAREKRSYTSSELYVTGFNRVILAGQDLAAQGLNKPFESLYRFPEVPKNMLLAVAEGRGEDILKSRADNAENIAIFLYTLLREPRAHSIPAVTLHDFDADQGPGRNPVMPVLRLGGVHRVYLSGIAIFKKDRMVSMLDLYQSRTLSYLRGIGTNGYIPYILEDGKVQGVVLVENKRKVTAERQGDKINFRVQVSLSGIIPEHPSELPLDENRTRMIEEYVRNMIEQDCRQFIKTMQTEWKFDCIDVSKYALAKWRSELTDRVDDEQFIKEAEIEVEVKVKLQNSGEFR